MIAAAFELPESDGPISAGSPVDHRRRHWCPSGGHRDLALPRDADSRWVAVGHGRAASVNVIAGDPGAIGREEPDVELAGRRHRRRVTEGINVRQGWFPLVLEIGAEVVDCRESQFRLPGLVDESPDLPVRANRFR